ncbi:MAG: T9SS type A sorting domain-containing protein, partial [Bacteroidetes bacterium]|nr:T9SS type A sorting domain-containing protein [Bacteroidota bacterium]MBU0475421.1 T9SS type A sorting domain-containing protein [Bacteroidota bacterium]MBU1113660.1 T9SS type A sorting domain-containing protein [Bacteroidota bacterium]MBU1113937.1 T9SS type A sorting domain-containing protein [Bacteroidota bacterium]MBU1796754.1 T9SS type A sorting domain-containing protein [Bacteroidota bacterium]
AELVNREMNAGIQSINFDATNFSSGIYFYRISAGNFIETKKMVLMK